MMFPKTKRVVDLELLSKTREYNCFVCGKPGPSDPHHITSKGAGGGDVVSNLIPLCRRHHTEIHKVGLSKFAWNYPKFKDWLMMHDRFDILEKLK